MKAGSGVAWAIWIVLAVVAWSVGVLWPAVLVSIGFVLGVATTWLYARIRIGAET